KGAGRRAVRAPEVDSAVRVEGAEDGDVVDGGESVRKGAGAVGNLVDVLHQVGFERRGGSSSADGDQGKAGEDHSAGAHVCSFESGFHSLRGSGDPCQSASGLDTYTSGT